jgi:hypothetical protein
MHPTGQVGNQGLGKIAISPNHSISNDFLVDSLDYNMLSVSQLCKIGNNYLFTDVGVTVFRRSDDSIAFKVVLDGQLYLVDVEIKNLHKHLKGEHILGLTNVHFEKRFVAHVKQGSRVELIIHTRIS